MSFVRAVQLRVPAAAAKPGPAIGQALGPLGINMAQFCKEFNDKSGEIYESNTPLRVELRAMSDRSFTFSIRSPPTAWLVKKAAGIEKGPQKPNMFEGPSGYITPEMVHKIALIKQGDDNTWHLPLDGDGADFALALVYIGKGASVSVGGDLVVGGNAAAYSSSNGSGNGNGALIMAAGTSSDLSVDGILRIGGSGVCGSGTLDLSAATKATVVATDLEVCDPQSRVVMGKGSILKLQADRRKEVKDMMSNEELVLVDAATEFFTEYRNGVTMVSVIDSPVGCPGDVDVLTQTGAVTAEFDRIYDSIHISEQNTTTVTVDLSQLWSREAHIDHIYYAYRQYAPNSRLQGWSGDIECYEKESVPFGSMKTPYDTITAACHALAPYAKLEICVVDDLDNGIVKPLISTTVAEVVPHCCLHKIDSAKPQSAVCYILDINCAPPTDGRCELGTGDETKEQAKRRLDVQLEFLRRV